MATNENPPRDGSRNGLDLGDHAAQRVDTKNSAPFEEKQPAQRLFDLFKGYELARGSYDVPKKKIETGKKAEGRAITIKQPATPAIWDNHLAGKGPGLGIIPLLAGNSVVWGCIDIDVYNIDHAALEVSINVHGYPLVMCRSKSGGAHCFVFFSEPVPAKIVVATLAAWAAALGHAGREIFPKQVMRYDEKDVGNWLNMPYYRAEETARYGIKDGAKLELPEFLEYAESRKVGPEALMPWKAATTENRQSRGTDKPLPKCLTDIIDFEADAGAGSEHIGPKDCYPPNTIEEIEAALAVLDPDCKRWAWFTSGCALFAALGVGGFDYWNGWSRKAKRKYKGDYVTERQWQSIIKGNGYNTTIATLFWYANAADPDWWKSVCEQEPHCEPPLAEPVETDQTKPATPPDTPVPPPATQSKPWPVMGNEAYYGFAGEVVETLSPHSEADPVALLIQFLTCFGNIIGREKFYLVESDRHGPNLFSVLVGGTGNRKGTSLNRIKAIFNVAYQTWVDEQVQTGLSSGEGLINVVRDPMEKWDAKEQKTVVMDQGVADKRLLLVEPEFASVLAAMERSGNTVSSLIRKAWDGDILATMTRASPLKATGAHISVIGHITEEELRTRLTRTDMANGFANRLLFALVKRSKELPFGGSLPPSQIIHLGESLKNIVNSFDPFDGTSPQLPMTDAARQEWARIYSRLSAGRPGMLGAVTARAEAQTIRLALLYALLDRAKQIDFCHLRAGLAIWRYCEASASHIFGDSLGDEVADRILPALVQAGAKGMTRTVISSLFSNHRGNQISNALALLLERGRARTGVASTTSGRPSEVWWAC